MANRSLCAVSSGGKPRVLVVDDQEALRTLLSRLLDREGFESLQAADGEQAVEVFKNEAPLVVVSDIMMPRMDGLTLLREIKRIDVNATVILMTGQGNEDVLLKALRGGASNFFKKPFNVKELIDEVRKVVDFRLEAARSTLFSPLLVEESKSFIMPRADSPYFPIINQITLQLPCVLPSEDILNIKIGIEEMITNAIEHGNLGISFEEKNGAIEEGRLSSLIAERSEKAMPSGAGYSSPPTSPRRSSRSPSRTRARGSTGGACPRWRRKTFSPTMAAGSFSRRSISTRWSTTRKARR